MDDLLVDEFLGRTEQAVAPVVDNDINGAEGAERCVDDLPALGRVGDVQTGGPNPLLTPVMNHARCAMTFLPAAVWGRLRLAFSSLGPVRRGGRTPAEGCPARGRLGGERGPSLEQGSDHHPSAQVLDAIARALRLDADATAHLHELAAPSPDRRRRARRTEQDPPSVRQLLNCWHTNLAFVQGRFLDVLAANPLMMDLSPMCTPGRNILRAAFIDSAVSKFFCDTDVRLENAASALRASAGPDVDDPQLTDLIGELERTRAAALSGH